MSFRLFLCLVFVIHSAVSLENGQQAALERIYESCGGDKWTVNTNWLKAADGCTWAGVTCTGDRVQKLILPNNNMVGAVPSEIGQLATTLEELDLGGNKLTSLPNEFATLVFLKLLKLEGNPMPSIGFSLVTLVRLTTLDFDNMGLGALPLLPGSLEVISLDNNQLQTIAATHTTFPALKVFSCQNNILTAIAPGAAAGWAVVEEVDVDNNQLTSLPDFDSTALRRVSAEHNNLAAFPAFDGTNNALADILLGWNDLPPAIPLFYGVVPNLALLKLNNNPRITTFPAIGAGWLRLSALYLSGTAVNVLPADFSSAPALVVLEMNDITPKLASVPQNIAGLATLSALRLANNSIIAPFGSWASLTGLTILDLSGNGLTVAPVGLPASLVELHLARNSIGNAPVLTSLVALKTIDLSSNSLAGAQTFSWGASVERILLAGNALTSLPAAPASALEMDMSGNPIQEVTPGFFTAGMALQTLTLNDVVLAPNSAALPSTIDLANNLVSLSLNNWSPKLLFLPIEIGGLVKLEKLSLRDQNLGGLNAVPALVPPGQALPVQIQQLVALEVLDLSGNRLSSVDDIPALDGLVALKELYVSNNPLKAFPKGVKDIANLEVIEMKNAQLNGNIPDLTLLTRLKSIDFEGNKLTGALPVTLLLSATQLKSLNVNNNALSGQVPLEADKLTDGRFGGNHFACGPGATSIGLLAPPACLNPPSIIVNGVAPKVACTYGTNRLTLTLSAPVPNVPVGENSQYKCKVDEVVVPAIIDGNDKKIVYCDVPAYGGENTFPVSFANYGDDFSSVDASHTISYQLAVCDPFINGASSSTLRAVTTLMVIFLILLLIVSLVAFNLYLKKRKLDADSKSYRLLNEQNQ